MPQEQCQQGDVLFHLIPTLPTNAQKCKDKTLALGEHTGHAHEVISDDAEVWEHGGMNFVVVPDGSTATVRHHKYGIKTIENHEDVILDSGVHAVGIVVEYDHFAEEAKRVQD